MIIKNFSKIATSKTRKDALAIINAGIESVLPSVSMKKQIKIAGNKLSIQGNSWNLSKYYRIYVVGAGKASCDMAKALEGILGNRVTKGLVIDTRHVKLKKIKVVQGTHPLPSQVNVDATKEIVSLLESASSRDLVINLISGGGSALLVYPRIELERQIEVTKMLLKRGAAIQEINTVRKHLSYVKGGQLAKFCSDSDIITLIISDVISNNLEVIASGPTVLDTSTVTDAMRIAKKYKLPSLPFVETPKIKLDNVTNILLFTNVLAAKAMEYKAMSLRYKTKLLSTNLNGEAREVGKKLAKMAWKNTAIIAAGETTVNVRGDGKGGRNQELVLSACKYIKNGVVVSCSTDGVDFITESAGGIVDDKTLGLAEKAKLDVDEYLNNNNSYNFLKKTKGVIVTDKTGTNVGDLMLVLGNK